MKKRILPIAIAGVLCLSVMTAYAISSKGEPAGSIGEGLHNISIADIASVDGLKFNIDSLTRLADTTGNDDSGEIDLVEAFDPNKLLDINTGDVIITDELRSILGLYGITEETHDVDEVIRGVVYYSYGKDGLTNDNIADSIKDFGDVFEFGKIAEDAEAQAQQSESQTPSGGQQGGGQQGGGSGAGGGGGTPAPQPQLQPQPSGGGEELDPEIQAMFDSTPGEGMYEGASMGSGTIHGN